MYFNIIIYTFYVVNFIYYTTFIILLYTTFIILLLSQSVKAGGLTENFPPRVRAKKEAADKWGSQPLWQLRK